MANKSRVSAAKSTTTKIRRMKNGDKIPKDLEYSLTNYLTQSQKLLVLDLCSEELGQAHLFDGWLQAEKVSPSVLRQMGRELEALNASIPGGLRKYVLNAKNLLKGKCKTVEKKLGRCE